LRIVGRFFLEGDKHAVRRCVVHLKERTGREHLRPLIRWQLLKPVRRLCVLGECRESGPRGRFFCRSLALEREKRRVGLERAQQLVFMQQEQLFDGVLIGAAVQTVEKRA
jgi:hypothetical protein